MSRVGVREGNASQWQTDEMLWRSASKQSEGGVRSRAPVLSCAGCEPPARRGGPRAAAVCCPDTGL